MIQYFPLCDIVWHSCNIFSGFQGCIRLLKLGHREIKIQSSHEPMTIKRVGITECTNARRNPYEYRTRQKNIHTQVKHHQPFNNFGQQTCNERHCLHGGTCFVDNRGRARCICTEMYGGDICEYKSRTWKYKQAYGKNLFNAASILSVIQNSNFTNGL